MNNCVNLGLGKCKPVGISQFHNESTDRKHSFYGLINSYIQQVATDNAMQTCFIKSGTKVNCDVIALTCWGMVTVQILRIPFRCCWLDWCTQFHLHSHLKNLEFVFDTGCVSFGVSGFRHLTTWRGGLGGGRTRTLECVRAYVIG